MPSGAHGSRPPPSYHPTGLVCLETLLRHEGILIWCTLGPPIPRAMQVAGQPDFNTITYMGDMIRVRLDKSHSYCWLYKDPRDKTSFPHNIPCSLSQRWAAPSLPRYPQATDKEAEERPSPPRAHKSCSSACAPEERGGLTVPEIVQLPEPLKY